MTLLFNHHCLLCGECCLSSRYFCQPCFRELPAIGACCSVCGREVINTNNTICGLCSQQTPAYHTTIVPFYYQEPISTLITSLKFNNQLGYARVLAELMAPKIEDYYKEHNKPKVIIPIPLHTKRLYQRGFNQVILLAKRLQQVIDIPVDCHRCQRVRDTPSQHLLPKQARQKNLRAAFECQFCRPIKHVALLDDVITTGTTINTMCTTLKKHGITTIDIWACARTRPAL